MKPLLELLADGEFHSGEDIGFALGVSRSAVWKMIKRLSELQVELHAVTGRGYQIPGGLELLDSDAILAGLQAEAKRALNRLIVLESTVSTNQYLLDLKQTSSGIACLAEHQTNGRGRRARAWVSPYGANIYFSLLWNFPGGATDLTGLSLAVGVMVAEALRDYGLHEISLKWPNDILYRQHKLGGILLEMVGNIEGPCQVVIGIGLNVSMSRTLATGIEQAWTDIRSIIGQKPARNRLVSLLLNQLLIQLPVFEKEGFHRQKQFRAWERASIR
jgi:BirA family biotin operon repressor/biotin-[acetyl-CoA-carboxylase] ligase